MSEFSGRVRGVVNTPTTSAASGRWSVRALAKYVAAGVWPRVAAPGGDMDLLSFTTVGSGGTGSIVFSPIAATYQHLQIRFMALHSNGGNGLYLFTRFNGDTGANYRVHRISGDGNSATSGTTTVPSIGPHLSGSVANTSPTVGIVDILDYASTTKTTTVRALIGADTNGTGEVCMTSMLWTSTAAVNSVTLAAMSQGNPSTFAQSTTAALYGIKAP